MEIENENSFRVAITSKVNVFLGSGFSVLASNAGNEPLPLANKLAEELGVRFSVPGYPHLDLPKICTIIERSRKAELRGYLKERFSVRSFDARYRALTGLPIAAIFTTNIDDLLFQIFADSRTSYLNDMSSKGPEYNDRRAVDLVTLHGCVIHETRPFTFSTIDIASAFSSDEDGWRYLKIWLRRAATLFWGYSLNDAATLQALGSSTAVEPEHEDKWIVVHPSSADEATTGYFQALGFQIIKADTSEMLDYIGSLEIDQPVPNPTVPTKTLFPQEAIPPVGTVPVRPILDFYLGAPPQWSDIYSAQVHRTAHFTHLRDCINSGKNTLVIGVPACGKTALIMQAAAHVPYSGHKLMMDSLSLEKARLIDTMLGGQKALVFVDNFADSVEGFSYLGTRPNVQIVGADRDYNFEIASHRLDIGTYSVVDATELSQEDIQGCLENIPGSITNRKYIEPEIGPGLQPSLFEIIEANITGPTLKERFRSVLRQLNDENTELRDLLLMISYVNKCRVPVSMDMVIAFMREITTDYHVIYDMLNALGRMVSAYIGDISDLSQDYFVARSTLVGEAVLSAAGDVWLKNLLTRFHANVSPLRIYRYNVFCRYAYDSDLAVRAFSDVNEGKQWYDSMFQRDDSPYLLQQGALYLSKKGHYKDAFELIDRANTISGHRNFSIRNSHAIILFKANFEHANDPSARNELRRSMEILSDCYKSDKRKPYHALTYADQALRLRGAWGDTEAGQYLRQALTWLEDEASRSPWNRGLQRLLPKVRGALVQ